MIEKAVNNSFGDSVILKNPYKNMAVIGDIKLLSPGSKVPSIKLTDQNGDPISLADYHGQKLVLFLFAKGGSGTCLNEALNLKEGYQALKAKGYEVLGLSPEKASAQKKQIDKRELPFSMIADPEHELIEALGAWGLKKMYGKEYMGIIRTTFLIDENGLVSEVIEKVKSKEHYQQILDLIG